MRKQVLVAITGTPIEVKETIQLINSIVGVTVLGHEQEGRRREKDLKKSLTSRE